MLPFIIGIAFFQTPILHAATLSAGLVLSAFCFATLGTLFAAYPTENVGEVMSMLNMVRLPLIFVSGVFIPLESMPGAGQIVALCSPLTYANDMIRLGYDGTTHFGLIHDVVFLVFFVLIFQFVANRLYKKFNE
jgi:ABC-2 type transport system permease protein